MNLAEIKMYPVGMLPCTDRGKEIIEASKQFTEEQWKSLKPYMKLVDKRYQYGIINS